MCTRPIKGLGCNDVMVLVWHPLFLFCCKEAHLRVCCESNAAAALCYLNNFWLCHGLWGCLRRNLWHCPNRCHRRHQRRGFRHFLWRHLMRFPSWCRHLGLVVDDLAVCRLAARDLTVATPMIAFTNASATNAPLLSGRLIGFRVIFAQRLVSTGKWPESGQRFSGQRIYRHIPYQISASILGFAAKHWTEASAKRQGPQVSLYVVHIDAFPLCALSIDRWEASSAPHAAMRRRPQIGWHVCVTGRGPCAGHCLF
mmetsp:Transcript_132392/g.264096  ORF Transcript_132392/g.264096 Transcript_132392/m.264096 type:complete len:255 (-) Transcript_132392:339-1103(-)